MKKVSLLLIPVLFVLSGCGNTEKTMNCTMSLNDVIEGYKVNSTYEVTYTGEGVKKVVTKEEVTSDTSETLDSFKETLDKAYQAANDNYGGYTYNVTKSGNKVVSEVTIDYEKMDLTKFVNDQPSLKNYINKNNNLTINGIQSLYESMGATCTK